MPNDLTTEIFANLLNLFSGDPDTAAVEYTRLHEALIRYFETKGVSEPHLAADETIDRVAEKLSQSAEIKDIFKYAFGVARYVALENYRRERFALRVADQWLSKAMAATETDGDFEVLRDCFRGLYPKEQRLLLEYYSAELEKGKAEFRRQLAEREKVSLNTLRIRVSRLRKRLEDCLSDKKSAIADAG